MYMERIFQEAKCIGVLGGTFNPVHKGHVMLVKAAKEQFHDIDNIVVIPNNIPAYKDKRTVIASEHRINMLRLAFDDYPHTFISELEIKRGGLTYTYDTLMQLKAINPELKVYFIIGADSMYNFKKWFRYEDVLKMCTLLVSTRKCNRNELECFIRDFINSYPYAGIKLLETDNIDISSSELRDNIFSEVYQDYVPDKVIEYIKDNKLYGWK